MTSPREGSAQSSSSASKAARKGKGKVQGRAQALAAKREEYVAKEAGLLKEVKALKAQIADLNRMLQRKDESNKKLRKELARKTEEQDATQTESMKLSTEYEQLISTKEGTIEQMMQSFDEERAELKKARFAAEEKKRSAVRAMKREKQLRQEAELILEEERLKMEKATLRYNKAKKDQVLAASKLQEATNELSQHRKTFEEAVERKRVLEEERATLEEKHRLKVEALEQELGALKDSPQLAQLTEQVAGLEDKLRTKGAKEEELSRDLKDSMCRLEENQVLVSSLTQEVKKLTDQLNERQAVAESTRHEEQDKVLAEKLELSKRLDMIHAALANRNISVEFLLGSSTLTTSPPSPKKAKAPAKEQKSLKPVALVKPLRSSSSTTIKTSTRPSPVAKKPSAVSAKGSSSSDKIIVKPVQRGAPSKSDTKSHNKRENPATRAIEEPARAKANVPCLPKVKIKLRSSEGSKDNMKTNPLRKGGEKLPASKINSGAVRRVVPREHSADARHEDHSTSTKPKSTSAASSSSTIRVTVRKTGAQTSSRIKQPKRTVERERTRRSINQAESPGSRRNPAPTQPPQRRLRKPAVKQENLTKLDLGVSAADIAPESTPLSDTNSEGGLHSLLFPREDHGGQRREGFAS